MFRIAPSGRVLCAALLVLLLVACGDGNSDEQALPVPLSTRDSLATALEFQASQSGDIAPGKQSYSFRGLYAGMTRDRLEQHVRTQGSAPVSGCHPSDKPAGELACVYDAVVGSDSAHVRVEAQFTPDDGRGHRVARTISVSRELPLDVDGVRLARALSRVFEAQTSLLDKRDESYGHQRAELRMGTVNGERQNFIDLSVVPRGGRELLTVKMSRR